MVIRLGIVLLLKSQTKLAARIAIRINVVEIGQLISNTESVSNLLEQTNYFIL